MKKDHGIYKKKKKLFIPVILIVIGVGLIFMAAAIMAVSFPWGMLLGSATNNADGIADPSPIILDKEDQGVLVTYPFQSEMPVEDTTSMEVPADRSEEPVEDNQSVTELPSEKADADNEEQAGSFVVLGVLKIPLLEVSQNLLEGTEKQLKYGVGHVVSTEMPGEKGNCAIAGHRYGPFHYLDMLNAGDAIVIQYDGNTYTYSVYESFTVLPTEVWVLDDVDADPYTLTLITCTPYMIYSHRLIVRAKLTDINGMTPDEYFDNTDLLS